MRGCPDGGRGPGFPGGDMVQLNDIDRELKSVDLWKNGWFLLTAGTMDSCNMMTVSWGSIGCMWHKPFAQAVVRPQRYTRTFMDTMESFTLCAFDKRFQDDLKTLGSISGRDGNKLEKTGLHLKPSTQVAAPGYHEAQLILECKTIYFQDMDPKGFVDPAIEKCYGADGYHRIYYGEIVAALSGLPKIV